MVVNIRTQKAIELLAFVAAILVISPMSVQAAQLTSITYSPNPIILGGGVTFVANDDGAWPIASYKWEVRCASGTRFGNWVTVASTSKTYSAYMPRPGSYEVRCTATFRKVSPAPPPSPSTTSVLVTISQANADKVIAGLDTPTSCGATLGGIPPSKLLVLFEILVGNTAVGPHISGTLQERIRRPQFNFDSGWQNGNQDLYIRGDGRIVNNKTVTIIPPDDLVTYNQLLDGTIIDDFYQQFRIVTVDTCNSQDIMYLT